MTMNELFKQNRFGTFTISNRLLCNIEPTLLFRALERVFITKCEYNFAYDSFVYEAFSMDFEPVEEGNLPHEYFITFIKEQTCHSDYSFFKWRKR